MSKPTCALLLIFLTSLVACDNEISSASRLRRPRLFAVQAEPLDVTGFYQPILGLRAEL